MSETELGYEDLKRISDSVGERRGWDFSRVRRRRDPVPWEFVGVVRHYLKADYRVLDVGTGGGERFLQLAPYFGAGVGIDPDPQMIRVARENVPPSLIQKVSFQQMYGEDLAFQDGEFGAVLNKHAPVDVEETVRILASGGVFITQQVGERNTQSICALLGCASGGEYEADQYQRVPALAEAFRARGCAIAATAEYDVPYWFLDVESLVFWLKAVPVPENFDMEVHWRQVQRIIVELGSSEGIETNQHYRLLIARKP